MCWMAYYPPGVMPDREHLENACRLNPHGFGYAWQGDHSVYVDRTLGAELEIRRFLSTRDLRPDVPAVFHARYATGTPVTLANCQPLRLADGGALAHNGALWDEARADSDTRIFAEEMLPKWNLADPDQRAHLEEVMGYSKMIIIPPTGDEPMILNEAIGLRLPDGAWHSNTDGFGAWHLRAGQCGVCGRPMPDAPAVSRCATCTFAAALRRQQLVAP